ncbi:hypothetical protein EKN08_03825 [Facklamia hominis]|nr:hypothetical protein HMPREF9260_01518 [Facklamia hominis ACS-120-V-Sch10]PKY93642.1 hypothetical protein CYJ56_01735 [Facklamia hominis]RYC98334.1 hypothetical protein EKN08_03825 [Facklamia hominis]
MILMSEIVKNQKIINFEKPKASQVSTEMHMKKAKRSYMSFFVHFVAIICLAFALISCVRAHKALSQSQAQLTEAQTAFKQTQNKYQAVQLEYQRSQDPEYLAKLARRDYFYSKEGEIIFDIESDKMDDYQIFSNTK